MYFVSRQWAYTYNLWLDSFNHSVSNHSHRYIHWLTSSLTSSLSHLPPALKSLRSFSMINSIKLNHLGISKREKESSDWVLGLLTTYYLLLIDWLTDCTRTTVPSLTIQSNPIHPVRQECLNLLQSIKRRGRFFLIQVLFHNLKKVRKIINFYYLHTWYHFIIIITTKKKIFNNTPEPPILHNNSNQTTTTTIPSPIDLYKHSQPPIP